MNMAITKSLGAVLAFAVLATPVLAKESAKIRGTMEGTDASSVANGKVACSFKSKKSKLSVKAKGLAPLTSHTLIVAGVPEATAVSNAGGNLRFDLRSDKPDGLDFDPRGEIMTVSDDASDLLTMVVSGPGEPVDIQVDERTDLKATSLAPAASGEARFRLKKGRRTFKVEIEDVAVGSYDLFVAGVLRASISVDGTGEGEVEFDSEPSGPKLPLDFDPRGQTVDVASAAGVVLSATMVAQAPGVNVCTETETSVLLDSSGADPDASGDARYRTRADCDRDFQVQIEDVPVGFYDLYVSGVLRGVIEVVDTGLEIQGELEFDTDPDDPGELLLDFDPNGQEIEVRQGATVYFSTTFSGTPGAPSGCVESETLLALLPSGAISGAKGDGRFRVDDDCDLDFRVEIEDVPLGAYDLRVGGVVQGAINVVDVGGENEGQIEFDTDPDEPGELPLTFEPRGALVEVLQGATVVLSRDWPAS